MMSAVALAVTSTSRTSPGISCGTWWSITTRRGVWRMKSRTSPNRSVDSRSTMKARSAFSSFGACRTFPTPGRNRRFRGAGWWHSTSTAIPRLSMYAASASDEPKASPSGLRCVPIRTDDARRNSLWSCFAMVDGFTLGVNALGGYQ